MNNVFRWVSWVGVFMAFVCGLCLPRLAEAASHELNYFQTSRVKIDGANALRIEIGMTGEEPKYTIKEFTYLRRQLVITLPNTTRGKVKNLIRLKGDLAKEVRIRENGDNLQITIDCVNPPTSENYRISTLPAERRKKKPARIIVEILDGNVGGDTANLPGIKGKTIVVDAGHGGSDSGAVGPTGVKEKDVTFAVVDVYAPNATDRQELQARCDIANRNIRTALFLSIHCNAFSNPAAHGMETYYCAGSVKGQELATLLNEELARAGGRFNRGVKTANYYVLRHTNMPASLVELAFVTNYQEERLLNSDAYQNKLAQAIVRGIARYFKG